MSPLTMEALVYEGPRVMAHRSVPVPAPGVGEVLVRVAYSGICGSELSGYLGQSSIRQAPLIFGHELSGWVHERGPEAEAASTLDTRLGLPLGAAVTVNPLVSCGHCRHCLSGHQQRCPARLLLGASLPGCNAEFVVVPESALFAVPASLSMIDAAMVEPAAFAVRAVEISGAGADSSALVIGAGPIGLLILQVLEQCGVRRRFVAELNPARLAMAEALGAVGVPGTAIADSVREATAGEGADLAFDAVGAVATRRNAVASVCAGGTVVLVGLHTDETPLPLNTVVRSEITLTGAFAYSPRNFSTALAWIGAGRLGLRSGVEVVPLTLGGPWYQRLIDGDPTAKVLLQPQPAELS